MKHKPKERGDDMFKKLSTAAILAVSFSSVAIAAPQSPSVNQGSGNQSGSSVIAPAPQGGQAGGGPGNARRAPAAMPHHAPAGSHNNAPPAGHAGAQAPSASPSQGGSGASSVQAPKIDINKADKQTLQMLPGVSDQDAQNIVNYRKAHGDFKSVDQMYKKVKGVKKQTVDNFSDILKAGGNDGSSSDHSASDNEKTSNS